MTHEKSKAEKALDAAKAEQACAQAAVDAERRDKVATSERRKDEAPQRVLVSKHDCGPAVVIVRAGS